MKLECDKTKIEQAVQKAARLANKHLTLPVLSCIHFEATSENKLILKSTNLDIGLEMEMKVKVLTPGSLAVPANVLVGVLSSIKESDLVFETTENNLKISTSKNSVVIKCMHTDDFPSIPKIQDSNQIKIGANDLLLGFKSVWYSASNSNIKPELGSVYVYKNDNGLTFVSTDSFRLAEKKLNIKINNDFPSILIPYKNVVEIIKLFEDYKDEINIIFEKNQAAFVAKDMYVVSRLVDGTFPDYNPIIPKEFVATVTVLKNDLINAIKTSNIFSDTLNQVKIKVDTEHKTLNLESKNNDVGEYKESIKANVTGGNIELNFNNKYVTDCMQSLFSESLVLGFGGIGKPLHISSPSDKSFMYIVMPMNR